MESRKEYNLPWTPADNILVWYDITKNCGMNCDLCYSTHAPGSHKSLERIKEELPKIKGKINFDVLALGGGEPLSHPRITEIIEFAKSLGLKVFLSTNASLLTDENLAALKKAGLEGINLHVDSLQSGNAGRYGAEETALNRVRSGYAARISAAGLRVFYNVSVSGKNVRSAGRILEAAAGDSDKVEYLVLAVLRPPSGRAAGDQGEAALTEVLNELKKNDPPFEYSAYLGSRSGGGVAEDKWCLAVAFTGGGKILGYAGPGFIRFFQTAFRTLAGKYPGAAPRLFYRMGFFYALLFSPFSERYRKILLASFREAPGAPPAVRLLNVFVIKPESVSMDETPVFFGG